MSVKNNSLLTLGAAAVLLNGVSQTASANPPDGKVKVDYRYTSYEEADMKAHNVAGDDLGRYKIDVHLLKVKAPITADTEVSAYLLSETMSGASPWYVRPESMMDASSRPVQVMSGPTIDESRVEVGADFRSYNEQSESTFSLSYSTENDYESIGFGYSGAWRFNQNSTTLSYGINGSKDYVDATIERDRSETFTRPTDQSKTRMGAFVGVSQVATKTTLLSASLGVSLLEGCLSDPYKLVWVIDGVSIRDDIDYSGCGYVDYENEHEMVIQDTRPDSQEQFNLGLSLREFFPKLNGALHANYSFYSNDWNVDANTFELAWYQNLPHGWQLIPSFRAYSQSAADFYKPFYTGAMVDGHYSSDYRLSKYTAESVRFRIQRSWNGYTANVSYEGYVADGDHPAMLEYEYIGLGFGKEF